MPELHATYLGHPAAVSSDEEQNLCASLARLGPSDLSVAGYEPAADMP